MNYYNEHDPKAADWLRQLIAMGEIPDGEVDTRSIEDVTPNELRFFNQCHFFAGIGGWPYALKLAGVPSDYPLWTGSCPCQPFSAAGKGTGTTDERHLWPAFHWIIRQCRPNLIFGEQVASELGFHWWDEVATDLESDLYACTAFDLPAASVGAPHIRSRLFWVGHLLSNGRKSKWISPKSGQRGTDPGAGAVSGMAYAQGSERQRPWTPWGGWGRSPDSSGMGHPQGSRPKAPSPQRGQRIGAAGSVRESNPSTAPGWSNFEWLPCSDGKIRPTQPGIFPLADGLPPDLVCGGDSVPQTEQSLEARAIRLKGYGNAIVPQVAATFIRAYFERAWP